MQWHHIRKRRSETATGIENGGDDVSRAQRQLERIVDNVCESYNVARSSVEKEIYQALQSLSANPAQSRTVES